MKVSVCSGRTCSERGSKYVVMRLRGDVTRLGYDRVEIDECLCQGNCEKGPTVLFDGTIFPYMNPVKASEELSRRVKQAKESLTKKRP